MAPRRRPAKSFQGATLLRAAEQERGLGCSCQESERIVAAWPRSLGRDLFRIAWSGLHAQNDENCYQTTEHLERPNRSSPLEMVWRLKGRGTAFPSKGHSSGLALRNHKTNVAADGRRFGDFGEDHWNPGRGHECRPALILVRWQGRPNGARGNLRLRALNSAHAGVNAAVRTLGAQS